MQRLKAVALWVYRRIGQMICFWFGGVAIYGALVTDRAYSPPEQIRELLFGGALLIGTGLVLKALVIWKEKP